MSGALDASETLQAGPARNDWQQPALWGIVVLAAMILLASFTGNGTGMFGWGFMMGMMWFWLLVPLLLILLLIMLILRLQEPGR